VTKRRDTGYRTSAFRPTGKGATYVLSRIPEDLWAAFRAACRAYPHPDGSRSISVRARLLSLITHDLQEDKRS
jgi:hypothetical protein